MATDDRVFTQSSKADAAQRGRAAIRDHGERVGFRVATLPTAGDSRSDGETVTVADLMAQLAQEADALRPRDGEFSIAQFARLSDMSIGMATRFLDSKVKANILQKRRGLVDGKHAWLYSAVDKE